MDCRYVLVRLVPDPIREEPINIGVILQTDKRIDFRLTSKLPRSVYTGNDLVREVFKGLEDQWHQRLQAHTEKVSVSGRGVVELPLTDSSYLEWLRSTHKRHIQVSEVRGAEVDIRSEFDFDGLLLHLFDRFVRFQPLAKRVVERPGTRLHTHLRRDFRPLIEEAKIRESAVVEGTILWSVDFLYRNAREVAILSADFSLKSIMEHAEHIFAAWTDLKEVKQAELERYTVLGNYRATGEFRKAARLLERVSTFVFEYESQRQSLLGTVYKQLESDPPLLTRQKIGPRR